MRIEAIKLSSNFDIRAFQQAKDILSQLTKKVMDVSCKILKGVGEIFSFPFRYFGSKTWSIPGVLFRLPSALFRRALGRASQQSLKRELLGSGYHFQFEKSLSPVELKEYLPYACATAFVHGSDPSWIEPFGYQVVSPKDLPLFDDNGVEAHENCYFDPQSGLKAAIAKKGDTLLVAFGALKSNYSELTDDALANKKLYNKNLGNTIKNWVGAVPSIYHQADNLFKKLQKTEQFKGKKVVLVGQCYGGSIASFLALKRNIKAYCFNTLPFGAGLQKEVGQSALLEADQYVTHITARGDWLSDPRSILRVLDRVASGVGIKTPGNFGRRYVIPSAYPSRAQTHHYAVGSVMTHLGYDKRTKPSDLPEKLLSIEEEESVV